MEGVFVYNLHEQNKRMYNYKDPTSDSVSKSSASTIKKDCKHMTASIVIKEQFQRVIAKITL